MTVAEAKKLLVGKLSGITDEAKIEAELILTHTLGIRSPLILAGGRELTAAEQSSVKAALERRLNREPLQYVIGEWYFMGLAFRVSPSALIPRQDTETLCEEALRLINERGYGRHLDICTGTGCVAISVKVLADQAKMPLYSEAADISEAALGLAEKNAALNGAEVVFRRADLFEGAGTFDLVTANPPYISDADMEKLAPELAFEPRLALSGGADGLELYRRIAADAEKHIAPGGALLMEVGAGEAEDVAAMFPGRETALINDLNGVARVVRVEFRRNAE